MQSMLNIHGSYGLALCVSGITHNLSLSIEMADHDRRREAMKKQRSEAKKGLLEIQDQLRTVSNIEEKIIRDFEVFDDEEEEDLASILHALFPALFSCSAKAA